jgi:hypothetical protein
LSAWGILSGGACSPSGPSQRRKPPFPNEQADALAVLPDLTGDAHVTRAQKDTSCTAVHRGAAKVSPRHAGLEPATFGSVDRCSPDGAPCPISAYDTPEKSLPSCLPVFPPNDPDLAAVVTAWPTLPDAIRAGILAMVKVARGRP